MTIALVPLSQVKQQPVSTVQALHLSNTKKFLRRPLIIQQDKVNYCAARTFPDELSALHAINGNLKAEVLVVANARRQFTEKFQKKVAQNQQTQHLFDKLFATYSSHLCKGKGVTSQQRNATLIFQQFTQVISKSSKEIITSQDAYTHACLKRGYCFTRIDLPLIADIFERNICLYLDSKIIDSEFGIQYKDQVVLVESEHRLEGSHNHPIFTRFIPQATMGNITEYMLDNRYTAPETLLPLNLYNTIHALFNRQAPLDLYQIIFGYADIPFTSYLNVGMQAVLDKENWQFLLQSFQNWNFTQTFCRRVTHLSTPAGDTALIQRATKIICSELFPNISSLHFRSLKTAEEYSTILSQNPRCSSLLFEGILKEDFNTIFTRMPKLPLQLTNLAVKFTLSKDQSTLTIPQLLMPLKALQGLSLRLEGYKVLGELLENILLCMPNLNYLDLNEHRVSEDFVIGFINKFKSEDIKTLDVSFSTTVNAPIQGIKHFPNSVTLKNRSQHYVNSLYPFLKVFRELVTINAAGCYLTNDDLNGLPELISTLEHLDLHGSNECASLDIISQLVNLKYLDITGWTISLENIAFLANLKNLQTLHAGGFQYATGQGECSNTSDDDELTSSLSTAIKKLLPNVQLTFKAIRCTKSYSAR